MYVFGVITFFVLWISDDNWYADCESMLGRLNCSIEMLLLFTGGTDKTTRLVEQDSAIINDFICLYPIWFITSIQ